MIQVKKHIRKGKNRASVVRKHSRRGESRTHRTVNGRREVFVDGFWKHDDYGETPTKEWSVKRLLREKEKLSESFADSLVGRETSGGAQPFPARKMGLLTRRLKKINRLLKQKEL